VSVAVTAGVRVEVEARYIDEQSDPAVDRYVFAYRIIISNESEEIVQLLRRHWYINELNGAQREVEGDGVVGEQPLIEPGECHAYTSGAVLESPTGSMRGTYQMTRADGSLFYVEIPEFDLRMPRTLH